MAGNTLGPRGKFAYTSDTGEIYNIVTDANLGAAAGLPVATSGTGQRKPTGFTLRGVYCEGVVDGNKVRKRLPVNVDSPLYATDSSTTVTIDGTTFTTTGRQGEAVSF